MHEPSHLRQVAESFGTDAERYDRARPRYPEDLIARILSASPGTDVLDVGSGTGIAARQFQAAGCRVLGVEPDARMAELARTVGVETEVATFEAWEPAGRVFDAVVAGQAWHWIDPVAGAAQAARVLRPGGLLTAMWNVFLFPPEVAESFAATYRRSLPDLPVDVRALTASSLDGYAPTLAKVSDGIREAGGFGDPEQWRSEWEWTYTRDAWLDQLPTHGFFTRLPPDTLAKVLKDVGAVIDDMGGAFTMNYTTIAVTAVRTGT